MCSSAIYSRCSFSERVWGAYPSCPVWFKTATLASGVFIAYASCKQWGVLKGGIVACGYGFLVRHLANKVCAEERDSSESSSQAQSRWKLDTQESETDYPENKVSSLSDRTWVKAAAIATSSFIAFGSYHKWGSLIGTLATLGCVVVLYQMLKSPSDPSGPCPAGGQYPIPTGDNDSDDDGERRNVRQWRGPSSLDQDRSVPRFEGAAPSVPAPGYAAT